jgi:hypothetical protein
VGAMKRSEMHRAIVAALDHVKLCEACVLLAARARDTALLTETSATLADADRRLAAACDDLNDATA